MSLNKSWGIMAGMDKHPTQAHRAGANRPLEEQRKVGIGLRQRVPRSAQAEWTPSPDRADPVAILIEQGRIGFRNCYRFAMRA